MPHKDPAARKACTEDWKEKHPEALKGYWTKCNDKRRGLPGTPERKAYNATQAFYQRRNNARKRQQATEALLAKATELAKKALADRAAEAARKAAQGYCGNLKPGHF